MAKRKKKPAHGKIRAGKIRVSVRITKSKAATRSARGQRKTKITEVRIGGRVISLEPTQVKTDRNTSGQAKDSFHMSKSSMAKNAGQLVDLAAGLLKTGAEFGAQLGIQSGVKGRKILKDQTSSIVTGATRRVSRVVRKGSHLAQKSIKKL